MGRRKMTGKPKAVWTAYTCFVQKVREDHEKKNPGEKLVFSDFNRMCGNSWKSMGEKERKPFQILSDQDKARHHAEMKDYSPPAGEPTGKSQMKKDPNAPKRPSGAFIWFCNDERPKVKEENPEFGIGDIAKVLGRLWAEVDPVLKNKYKTMSDHDKARYHREMVAYMSAKANAAAQDNGDARSKYVMDDIVNIFGLSSPSVSGGDNCTLAHNSSSMPIIVSSSEDLSQLASQASMVSAASLSPEKRRREKLLHVDVKEKYTMVIMTRRKMKKRLKRQYSRTLGEFHDHESLSTRWKKLWARKKKGLEIYRKKNFSHRRVSVSSYSKKQQQLQHKHETLLSTSPFQPPSTKLPKRPSDEKIKRLKSNDSSSLPTTTTNTTDSSQTLDNKLSFSFNIHKVNTNNSNVLQSHSSISIRKFSRFPKNQRKILVAQPRHLQIASYGDKSSSSIIYGSVSNSKLPSRKKVRRNLFNSKPPKDMSRLVKMASLSSPLKKFPTLNANIISPARTYQHSGANIFKSPESIALCPFKSSTPISHAKKTTTSSPLKNSTTFSKFEEPKRIINCKLNTSTSGIEEIEANRESIINSTYNNKANKIVELSPDPDITDFRSGSTRKSIPVIMKNSSAQKSLPFCNSPSTIICPGTPSNYFLKSPQLLKSNEKICDSPEYVLGPDEQSQPLKKGISAASFYSGHSYISKTWENLQAKLKSKEDKEYYD